MSDSETVLSWVNGVTGKTIQRTIHGHMYSSDQQDSITALEAGNIVCLTQYRDIAFITSYTARAENMAIHDEMIIYPNGRIIIVKDIRHEMPY